MYPLPLTTSYLCCQWLAGPGWRYNWQFAFPFHLLFSWRFLQIPQNNLYNQGRVFPHFPDNSGNYNPHSHLSRPLSMGLERSVMRLDNTNLLKLSIGLNEFTCLYLLLVHSLSDPCKRFQIHPPHSTKTDLGANCASPKKTYSSHVMVNLYFQWGWN